MDDLKLKVILTGFLLKKETMSSFSTLKGKLGQKASTSTDVASERQTNKQKNLARRSIQMLRWQWTKLTEVVDCSVNTGDLQIQSCGGVKTKGDKEHLIIMRANTITFCSNEKNVHRTTFQQEWSTRAKCQLGPETMSSEPNMNASTAIKD